MAEPPASPLGFASIAAHGVECTTGGSDAAPIVVRTAAQLRDAVEKRDIRDKAARTAPSRVVIVEGDIDLGVLANERPGHTLRSVGRIQVGSNVTVRGAPGATLRGGMLEVKGGHNVIIQNLRFRGLWELDPSGKYDELGWDYVRITSAGPQRSHHVWVDHCDFEKAYDGLLDINEGSDLVTVSWCRFAGDAGGPQKKVSLVGSSSDPEKAALDRGRLNVTYHHNWFTRIEERTPRARFGNIHFFNNLVEGANCATMSLCGAVTLVENCVYRGTKIATTFSHAEDNIAAGRGGTILILESQNLESRAPAKPPSNPDNRFEWEHNFKSNIARPAFRFNPPVDWTWEARDALPYAYTTEPVASLEAMVRRGWALPPHPPRPQGGTAM